MCFLPVENCAIAVLGSYIFRVVDGYAKGKVSCLATLAIVTLFLWSPLRTLRVMKADVSSMPPQIYRQPLEFNNVVHHPLDHGQPPCLREMVKTLY